MGWEIAIELRASDRGGRGVFTAEDVAPGKVVWFEDGRDGNRVYTRAELMGLPAETREAALNFCYMVGHDAFSAPLDPSADPANFVNHSCAPNCGFGENDSLVAMEFIPKGTELTYHYGMTESEVSPHAGIECRCGSDECRGRLAMDDWRSRNFVRRYYPYLTSYIKGRVREQGWHHGNAWLRDLGNSRSGLFAFAPIRKGSVVFVFAGKVVDKKHFLELTDDEARLTLQVGPELWQVQGYDPTAFEPTDQINHSCEASCGLIDSTTAVALRDLKAGDELTFDYGTANSGAVTGRPGDVFVCHCGAKKCRGVTSVFDWQKPDVIARYWPHFPPFVKSLIEARGLHKDKKGSSRNRPPRGEAPVSTRAVRSGRSSRNGATSA